MAWVTITGAGTTTATKFYGDSVNKIDGMFNGTDISDTVTIHSNVTWTFKNGAFKLRNPGDTYSYTIVPAAIAADRSLTLPLITGTDTLASLGLAQTWTGIQTFTTPVLGTPTSGTLTNCTGLPAAGVINTALTLTDTQTATNKTLTAPVITYTINAQTGTTYTPDIDDAKKIVTLSNASAITLTIPPNSSVAYAVGSSLTFAQIGAGQVTFAQGSGVTITSTGGTAAAPKLRVQYSSATAIKTATNTWLVVGDIK